MELSCFLITLIILGIGYALISGFLLFLLVEVQTPKSVIGVVVGTASFSEVMIYPFCSRIKGFVGGSYPCFIATVFLFCFRFFYFHFPRITGLLYQYSCYIQLDILYFGQLQLNTLMK